MLAMISTGTGLCFAQPAGPRTPERTGTLTAPTKFPIMVNGKAAGSTTLPIGAKVAILKEDTATGKVLVKALVEKIWVEAIHYTSTSQYGY